MSEYLIKEGQLWKVAGGHSTQAQANVECITKEEAITLAQKEHTEKGHWGRDAIKKALMDWAWCTNMDNSIMTGISQYGHCKNFRGTHLHALLDPIMRRHPFKLLVGECTMAKVDTTP